MRTEFTFDARRPNCDEIRDDATQPWMVLESGTTSDGRAMTSLGLVDYGVDLARTEFPAAAAVPLGS